jgi:hypothetical protein
MRRHETFIFDQLSTWAQFTPIVQSPPNIIQLVVVIILVVMEALLGNVFKM